MHHSRKITLMMPTTKSISQVNVLDFKIADNKSIFYEVHDPKIIINHLLVKGSNFDEDSLDFMVLAKLPVSWKDHCLKHIKETISIEEFQIKKES